MPDNNIIPEKAADKKKCPYCAESIQAAAIKCRFCGEWLENPAKGANKEGDRPAVPAGVGEMVLPKQADVFEGRSSYAAMFGSFVLVAVLTITAITIAVWPVKESNSDAQSTKVIIGLVMILLTVCWILVKMAVLKTNFYRLTSERLEYHRGFFGRKVDNIDLFRIADYKMERSMLDRILGIGTVRLFSSDKSDPEFLIYKVKNPQRVFDILSKSTFAADKKANIVHLE